jgi:putative membrane-bound dehydrogenase-like protein
MTRVNGGTHASRLQAPGSGRTPRAEFARTLGRAGLAAIAIAAGALPAIVMCQVAAAGQVPPAGQVSPSAPHQEPNLGGGIDLAAEDPSVALERLHPADGYEVNLFASEKEFPALANPLAMTFDDRGRLWVATSPTYPHVLPGQKPDDKLVVLEDTNRDGRADTLTVFADGLYLPMGFELGDGGVYVDQEPNLMFLKDTNGDGQADERRVVLHGFGTEDSHHAIHAFTWGPGGGLFFQEGTFLHSQVETPYGPVRLENAGVFRYEPRTEKLDVFVSYSFANPWGHVIDRWGQHFISDASNGNNYWGDAFSGHVDYPRKQRVMKEWTNTKVRPTAGIEFVRSRQFPDSAQGNFLINNVIGFHGIKQYKVAEEGSGFAATEVEPLLQSSDTNFRPVALRFGPDGALYVVDWFNPLVGHMQYSLRDARRDKTHGRVWRITAKGRPLNTFPRIHGESIEAQLELLKAYEDRTRYLARLALREQPATAVMPALEKWVAGLDPKDPDYQHHLVEALWVSQHHDVVNQALLNRVLQSDEFRARSAGIRVLHYWFDRVDDGMSILKRMVNDPAPRVRLEAVVALSFIPTPESADTALKALDHPMDDYLKYALESTMTTLEKCWKPTLTSARPVGADNPKSKAYLAERLAAPPVDATRGAPWLLEKGPEPPPEPGVRRIQISAVLDQLKFDVTRFTVKPGETVEIVLLNPDIMPHNLVIIAPGTLESVGGKAEAMASLPDGFQKNFVPATPEVLYSTKLISQGALARIRVTAPTTPGSYPYLCTFPGHWRVMNGIMEVTR